MSIQFPTGRSAAYYANFITRSENAKLHHKNKKAARRFKNEIRQQLCDWEDMMADDRAIANYEEIDDWIGIDVEDDYDDFATFDDVAHSAEHYYSDAYDECWSDTDDYWAYYDDSSATTTHEAFPSCYAKECNYSELRNFLLIGWKVIR